MTVKAHKALWGHLTPWLMQAMVLVAYGLGWIDWPLWVIWAPLWTYFLSLILGFAALVILAIWDGGGRHKA